MLNFQVHWFGTFWYTWTFVFQHFGLKLDYLFRVKIWHFGANRGHISKLIFSQKARPCMIPHLLSRCVKIPDNLISTPAWEKDKYRNNEKSQNVSLYFTNLPRNPTWTDCHQIWRVGCSRYLINCTKFFDSGFHGFDSVYVIKLRPGLPIDLRCRRYTVEMCMGMGFPMGQGIPCESHGNGNKTQNWEWE